MKLIKNATSQLKPGRAFSLFAFVITFLLIGSLFLTAEASAFQGDDEAVVTTPAESSESERGLNFLTLLFKGGWFMVPLAILSIVVISLAIERTLALRQDKMMPKRLVNELGRMAADEEGFDPRRAYQLCQKFPSAAAKVVQTMLLKAGRPQTEIEHAVSESGQREATRLHSAVSWLTLAAAVAPLIGLLGTVWGITQAFYITTQMSASEDKGPALAEGIYTALVTTMIGLAIAIPAAVLAHIFENRIIAWFNKIDEMVLNLTPQLEPLEGRLRTSADRTSNEEKNRVARNGLSAAQTEPSPPLPR